MRPCRCMEIGYRMRRRQGRRGREPLEETAFILQTSVVYASFTGSTVQASLCMNTGAQLSPRWNEKAGAHGMRYAPGYATCGPKETNHEET